MRNVKFHLLALMVLAFVAPMHPSFAKPKASPDPEAISKPENVSSTVVDKFYGKLIDVMKQGSKLGFDGRYQKLEPAIKDAFNLPLMTKLAVGSAWSLATEEERRQLIKAFSDFSVANYANQFKDFNGETFVVVGTDQAINGYIVKSKLTPKDADAVELNYLVQKDEQGQWRIVDVFLNGSISELAARRSEFTSIAKRDGIPALVNSLNTKSKSSDPS
jgi:phospholipid transport system substrate-binding protein